VFISRARHAPAFLVLVALMTWTARSAGREKAVIPAGQERLLGRMAGTGDVELGGCRMQSATIS
jgi:hypothetical protein